MLAIADADRASSLTSLAHSHGTWGRFGPIIAHDCRKSYSIYHRRYQSLQKTIVWLLGPLTDRRTCLLRIPLLISIEDEVTVQVYPRRRTLSFSCTRDATKKKSMLSWFVPDAVNRFGLKART